MIGLVPQEAPPVSRNGKRGRRVPNRLFHNSHLGRLAGRRAPAEDRLGLHRSGLRHFHVTDSALRDPQAPCDTDSKPATASAAPPAAGMLHNPFSVRPRTKYSVLPSRVSRASKPP